MEYFTDVKTINLDYVFLNFVIVFGHLITFEPCPACEKST